MRTTLEIPAAGESRVVTVDAHEFVIGRAKDCDLPLPSPLVSRRHCVVTSEDHAVYVRDLQSSNGTGLNDRRLVGERPLHDGDILWVADTPVEVRLRPESRVAAAVSRLSRAVWRILHLPEGAHSREV